MSTNDNNYAKTHRNIICINFFDNDRDDSDRKNFLRF